MHVLAAVFASPLRHAARPTRLCSVARGLSGAVLPKPAVWRRPSVISARPLTVSSSAPIKRPPSILQFLSSNVWRATHRSRIASSSRARNSFTPPPQGPWRRFIAWLNSIPSNVIFWGVLGINGAVFLSWQTATALYKSSGDPNLYITMMRNFTVNMENFRSGRLWTLLTASFSHEGMMHIFTNAFTFYFMAPPVLQLLGNASFLALYLGGGIFCSLASLWWNNNVKHNQRYSSHGASGAVYAVISFFACVAPKAQFALFGIIPLPAWLFVTGVFLMDGYESLTDSRSRTDSAGHIGGILAGIGYYAARFIRIL